MKTKIIRIGNSKGVRIPKTLIEESGIKEEIEMSLRNNEIVLRSAKSFRKDWEESFEKMAKLSDDVLLDQEDLEKTTDRDEADWTW